MNELNFLERRKVRHLRFSICCASFLIIIAVGFMIYLHSTEGVIAFSAIIASSIGIFGSNIIYIIKIYRNSLRSLIIKEISHSGSANIKIRETIEGFMSFNDLSMNLEKLNNKDLLELHTLIIKCRILEKN